MGYSMSKKMRPASGDPAPPADDRPWGGGDHELGGFFRMLVAAQQGKPGDIDLKNEVGLTAGKVYQFLEKNGESPLRDLRTAMEGKGPLLMASLGWLLREDKINVKATQQGIMVKVK